MTFGLLSSDSHVRLPSERAVAADLFTCGCVLLVECSRSFNAFSVEAAAVSNCGCVCVLPDNAELLMYVAFRAALHQSALPSPNSFTSPTSPALCQRFCRSRDEYPHDDSITSCALQVTQEYEREPIFRLWRLRGGHQLTRSARAIVQFTR